MERSFNFNDLFVFDLANNHQGSVEHGLNIIKGVAGVVYNHGIRGGMKFQFRQLDSFVHPSHHTGSDNKHIPRFFSTRLERSKYETMLAAVRKTGLLAICTPFDEKSVDVIIDMDFDIIKVASCSATDWPLIEKIAEANKPVIFSTGGLDFKKIDDLVSYFNHRGVDFAIMHCVSIYPTPDEACQLNQIDALRRRYPERVIGWSTHEDPDDDIPVQIAVAKGAGMFERHVGVETDDIKLNAYSSTPTQLDKWISGYLKAKTICGAVERPPALVTESEAIQGLRRGVYLKKTAKSDQILKRENVYFAMPCGEHQLSSGDWSDGIVMTQFCSEDEALMLNAVRMPDASPLRVIKTAIHEVKAMLNEAKIVLNSEFDVEYSHHYGVENFRETGAVLINCINREYCKKIIVQLPGQNHPSHFHRKKEETFQVLWGELFINVGGHERKLFPGETLTIQPGVFHYFWTDTGAIFEEVSTTNFNDDSYYRDKTINKMAREDRKTKVDHWGRFQIYNRANPAGASGA